MTGSHQPILAIVVPIYGHPALLIEAIESTLRQQTAHDYRIVLVNDGCPSPQSDLVCRQYARMHPERILYVHKHNGGLASARNCGIRVALATWPSVRAIYLLDADNRLHPHVLERSFALLQADPEAAWIFPDVHMFGSVRQFCDTTGAFSRLQLLAQTYCEAGSMVRREVFESGVAYDETMKPSGGCPMGYEDWDFWLQCLAAGFKGKHGPALGFRYRHRPESMLANSERDRAQIVGFLRAKHRQLYTPKWVRRHEQEEMPRFAIYLTDKDELILTSDCHDRTRRQTWAGFTRDLRRHQTNPRLQGVPATVVVTAEPTLNLLYERGLAASLFWLLEADLEQHRVFLLTVEQQMGVAMRYELSQPFPPSIVEQRANVLCALSSELLADCLQDHNPDALKLILEERDEPSLIARRLHLEHLERPVKLPSDPSGTLCAAIARLRPAYRAVPSQRINSRRRFFRTPSDAGLISRRVFNAPAVPPIHLGDQQRHIGFVVLPAEFHDFARIVSSMARETKRHGWRPHLFVLGSGCASLLAEFRDTFESIHLLPDEVLLQPDRLISLLGTMDVVVNNHSTALHAAHGDLKRLGVKMVSHVQSFDVTPDGLPGGAPYLALHYEHSLHKVLVPSVELQTFLLAKGLPPDKLLVVANAPGFEVPAERLEAALAERASRRAEHPLRVLFMGRFNRRHGLDRLVHLIHEGEGRLPEIAWRIVGTAAIEEDGCTSAELQPLKPHLHPPALDAHTLSRHYCWADVLVLLSRWEGASLSILEAQQFGCVPIATNCGAMSELIDDGQTGFHLENTENTTAFVEQALELFAALQGDRCRLIDMARQAATVRRAQTWQHTMRDLMNCLDTWVPSQGAA